MWSYYGTKKRLAKYYPAPKHDLIIEPFAGAAQYSLFGDNWKKDVTLYDKYKKIIDLWRYLISAPESYIIDLPNLKAGDCLDDFKSLRPVEKILLGFFCNPSSAMPKKTCTPRGETHWKRGKQQIIKNLHKIRHWVAICKPYDQIKNFSATWFIDPPYQYGGEYYHSSVNNKHIDYDHLADWCTARAGQIIVCENSKADWLPFKNLHELHGQRNAKTMEVVYEK